MTILNVILNSVQDRLIDITINNPIPDQVRNDILI